MKTANKLLSDQPEQVIVLRVEQAKHGPCQLMMEELS